ncbi:hypothetical protein H310_07713 [Aphanomyces invadans]|uniref:Uncharacterized protein n=1 Tax=Aphanomyces invadans TaxID=157072 RepID=A0A024U088_9STRA|nr:hypothetical protein H310_07713 [Aphanomyces invadans]ETV99644.1 hypothetical protein H310_07713 [Aphanomyces invadans]|eukprot:XP_008871420.1 hypothetical protein H310_07713 [Aphanomyces invadans]
MVVSAEVQSEQAQLHALQKLDEQCVQYQLQGNYVAALESMERALVLRRHFFGLDAAEVRESCKAIAEMCNLLSMTYLQQENYTITWELLKKAEILTEHHPQERATTLNNMACYFRRIGKLHGALSCLKRALAIELQLNKLQTTADTHLNLCAVLSTMGKHSEAVEHAQSALILLQDELFSSGSDRKPLDTNKDRVSVLCIAYHNLGVEYEYLKQYNQCVASYQKGVGIAEQYLGNSHGVTITLTNSYVAARRTVHTKAKKEVLEMQKSPKKGSSQTRPKHLEEMSPTKFKHPSNLVTSPRSHARNELPPLDIPKSPSRSGSPRTPTRPVPIDEAPLIRHQSLEPLRLTPGTQANINADLQNDASLATPDVSIPLLHVQLAEANVEKVPSYRPTGRLPSDEPPFDPKVPIESTSMSTTPTTLTFANDGEASTKDSAAMANTTRASQRENANDAEESGSNTNDSANAVDEAVAAADDTQTPVIAAHVDGLDDCPSSDADQSNPGLPVVVPSAVKLTPDDVVGETTNGIEQVFSSEEASSAESAIVDDPIDQLLMVASAISTETDGLTATDNSVNPPRAVEMEKESPLQLAINTAPVDPVAEAAHLEENEQPATSSDGKQTSLDQVATSAVADSRGNTISVIAAVNVQAADPVGKIPPAKEDTGANVGHSNDFQLQMNAAEAPPFAAGGVAIQGLNASSSKMAESQVDVEEIPSPTSDSPEPIVRAPPAAAATALELTSTTQFVVDEATTISEEGNVGEVPVSAQSGDAEPSSIAVNDTTDNAVKAVEKVDSKDSSTFTFEAISQPPKVETVPDEIPLPTEVNPMSSDANIHASDVAAVEQGVAKDESRLRDIPLVPPEVVSKVTTTADGILIDGTVSKPEDACLQKEVIEGAAAAAIEVACDMISFADGTAAGNESTLVQNAVNLDEVTSTSPPNHLDASYSMPSQAAGSVGGAVDAGECTEPVEDLVVFHDGDSPAKESVAHPAAQSSIQQDEVATTFAKPPADTSPIRTLAALDEEVVSALLGTVDAAPSPALQATEGESSDMDADANVLQEKERVIVLLNETAKAFQLQVASLQDELTVTKNLLAQRDMVVQDLQQHVQDLKNAYADQANTVQGLQSQLAVKTAALDEVESQLKTADAEFEALKAAWEHHQADQTDRGEECKKLNAEMSQLHAQVDQLNVINRRFDKQLREKASVVMVDACLSARDFSENQLISLRDDAIAAKAKELSLVTAANDGLRAQLDALETELERLEAALTSKDVELHRNAKRMDKLERHVATLEAAAKQTRGKELAMELSTKQNTQLLQCLQAEEAKSDLLRQQVDALSTDLAHVQHQATQIRSDAAVVEIDVQLKTKTLERQSHNLMTSLEKLHKEREMLRDELADMRSKARIEVEAMQGELVHRRNKQYELTLKLHETESQMHTLRSTNEVLGEELEATRSRMQELDRLHMEAKRWKEDMARTFECLRQEHAQLQRTLATDSNQFQVEKAALQGQLKELERFVHAQAAELSKSVDAKKSVYQDMQTLEKQIEGLHDRIHGLVAEANAETKRRMGLEMELKVAQDQLHQVQANSQTMLVGCYEEHKKLHDGKEKLKKRLDQLEFEYKREQHGKSQLLHLSYNAATPNRGNLVECWLSDVDLPVLVRYAQALAAPLDTLDLRSNRITDQGVKHLLQLVQSKRVPPHMKLQENFISPQGIRQLASGIEAMGYTIVIHDGRIEGTDASGTLTLDVSNNKDASVLVYTPSLPSGCKVKKQKPASVSKPDPLEGIYGADLVQTMLEKPKKDPPSGKNQSPRLRSPRSLPKL